MSLLPALRRDKDTATELSEVSELLCEIEPRIARLEAEKIAALGGEDYVARTLHINEQIAALSERRGTYAGRRRILEQRLAREAQDYRERQYEEAVDRRAARKAGRVRAAAELEQALKAVAVAARKYCEDPDTWPSGVYYPPILTIDADRMVGELAESCFAPKPDRFARAAPGPEQYLERLLTADKRASGFASDVADRYDTQLIEMRAARVPEPEPEPEPDETAEEAAA
jgi:hypothetical protein